MSKYKNGYWGKIQYWTEQLNNSIVKQDLRGVDSAHNKLNFFIGKQWDLDYPLKQETFQVV